MAANTTTNWTTLGRALRASAMDAHNAELPDIGIAYSFLLDNPEAFGFTEWPANTPTTPNEELTAAYIGRAPGNAPAKRVLVYTETGAPVRLGDRAFTFRGEAATVDAWRYPRTPESTGRVVLRIDGLGGAAEYYPSVINAEWRDAQPEVAR